MPLKKLTVSLVLLLSVSCGSIPVQRRDWSTYDGPGAEHFQREEVRLPVAGDAIEPVSRFVWGFNVVLLDGVLLPAGEMYKNFTPPPVRTGVSNVFRNALYPVRLLNNLFQGKMDGAGRETKRFLVNTTRGVGGLFEVSKPEASDDEDTGQSLAAANWEESSFVVLPVLGPSTVRDSVGLVGDTLMDPLTYFPPATLVRNSTETGQKAAGLSRLTHTNYDPYSLAQFLLTLNRGVETQDYQHPENRDECEHCAAQETLRAVFLGFQDPRFPQRGRTERVRTKCGGRLPYTYWLQPRPAPIVFVVPGLGGHRLSGSSIALAEMAYRNGFSAVTISSTMNFEFIEHGSSVELPGFAPVDAQDVHDALNAVRAEIEREHPGQMAAQMLMGFSLGAFHTFFIAANEARGIGQPFDLYVAVNPPARLLHGIERLDAYYNAPLSVATEKRNGFIQHLLRKVLDLASGGLEPTTLEAFGEIEAEFLIGLSFRSTLRDVIFQTQERKDRGMLLTKRSGWRRAAAYQEISDYSFMEYFYGFVLPYYAELRDDLTFDEAGARKLFDLCDVRSIQSELDGNERLYVVTNLDDFLLAAEDIEWLGEVVGERCIHFEHGGHLGNLHLPEVQDTIMDTLMNGLMESTADSEP